MGLGCPNRLHIWRNSHFFEQWPNRNSRKKRACKKFSETIFLFCTPQWGQSFRLFGIYSKGNENKYNQSKYSVFGEFISAFEVMAISISEIIFEGRKLNWSFFKNFIRIFFLCNRKIYVMTFCFSKKKGHKMGSSYTSMKAF